MKKRNDKWWRWDEEKVLKDDKRNIRKIETKEEGRQKTRRIISGKVERGRERRKKEVDFWNIGIGSKDKNFRVRIRGMGGDGVVRNMVRRKGTDED